MCGAPCEGIPPYRATSEYPYPHWQDGDYGACQCGAELAVVADGERAWLVDAADEEQTGAP